MTAAIVTNDGVWFGLAILLASLALFAWGIWREGRID